MQMTKTSERPTAVLYTVQGFRGGKCVAFLHTENHTEAVELFEQWCSEAGAPPGFLPPRTPGGVRLGTFQGESVTLRSCIPFGKSQELRGWVKP